MKFYMKLTSILRAIGTNRCWCYFLVHTFKIKKVWIHFIKRFPWYSQVFKNFIWLLLRKSSCVRVEILAVSIANIHLSNKKRSALDYLYPFLSFSVHKFCGRTYIFRKSFLSSHCSRIYIHVYTYLDYFTNFTPILTKVSIPFFLWKWVGKCFKHD